MTEPAEFKRQLEQLIAGSNEAEINALLQTLVGDPMASIFEQLHRTEAPTVRPVPEQTRGFQVRLDLVGAKPPIWRRLELPGDLTLPQVHAVIQAAMGWYDCHLHRFRTGAAPNSPYFVTEFDIEEGEEGTLEDGVRLDQVVAEKGDRLWYDYDFGDGWEHKLVVEAVLDEPPPVRCTAGKLAGPPEDCGGLGGYEDLAAWVRSEYDDRLVPVGFESADSAHGWLPEGWHPDRFSIDDANEEIEFRLAEPVDVVAELADLVAKSPSLQRLLSLPDAAGPTEVSAEEAAAMTEPYRTFLDVLGAGAKLTGAGYLPPALVEEIAERVGISNWWYGKSNREDAIRPVANLRRTARALGLVSVRKGQLSPTAVVAKMGDDPVALWRHIQRRLPLGSKGLERTDGWLALSVAASGLPAEEWGKSIGLLLHDLGWRSPYDLVALPWAVGDTIEVLRLLAGSNRTRGDVSGAQPAVAATARGVIRQR